MDSDTVRSYNALGAGIIAISFGAIFIRLAHAPAPVVAALRMIFSCFILVPLVLVSPTAKRELSGLSRKHLLLLLLAGTFLALHFILWISSLSLTGVTSSVVFVTMNPLFVALYTMLVLRERVSRMFWFGLGLAILGSVIIGGNDVIGGGARWKGDLLALGGAVAIAGYFLVGSRLRRRLSLIGYVFPVYTCAAIILFIAVLATGASFAGYGWKSYLYCFLMALVCQILGHSLFNWALKHLAVTVVTIAVLGEPVGASILALVLLHETPGLTEILGGASILFGIFLVLYCSSESSPGKARIASGG
jgi:drug/metabolite transporter (DMT)-like permease